MFLCFAYTNKDIDIKMKVKRGNFLKNIKNMEVLEEIKLKGISYKYANINEREKFSLSGKKLTSSLITLKRCGFKEVVIISTCNRTEIYYKNSGKDPFDILFNNHIKKSRRKFYFYTGKKAVRHLFEVAGSLDSMVIGEDQILKQVKEGYFYSKKMGLSSRVFNRMFEYAFGAAKKIKTHTSINSKPVSVPSIALKLLEREYQNLKNNKILILGSGEVGLLIAEGLHRKGAKYLTFANRTPGRAKKLVESFGGKVITIKDSKKNLNEYDIIIISTRAPHYIITKDLFDDGKFTLRKFPVTIIDLSVPRNVEERVSSLSYINLYNIDDLRNISLKNNLNIKKEVKLCKEIVEKGVDDFILWFINSERLMEMINFKKNTIKELEEYLDSNFDKEITTLLKDNNVIEKMVGKIMYKPFCNIRKRFTRGDLKRAYYYIDEFFK